MSILVFDFVAFLVFGLFVSAGIISNVVSGSSAGHLRDIILKSALSGTLIGLVVTLSMLYEPDGLLVAFNIAVLPVVYGWILVALHWLFVRRGKAMTAEPMSTGMAVLAPALWLATCTGAILYSGRYGVFFEKDAGLAIAIGAYGLFVFSSRDEKRDGLKLVATYLPILGLLILGVCALFLATIGVASDAEPAANIGLLALLYALAISTCLQLAVPHRVVPMGQWGRWLYISSATVISLFLFGLVLFKLSSHL